MRSGSVAAAPRLRPQRRQTAPQNARPPGRAATAVLTLLIVSGLALVVAAAATGLVEVPGISPPHLPRLSAAAATVVAAPVALTVPAAGIDHAPVDRLGLTASDTLAAPERPERAGWLDIAAAPGAPGPAVFAGHVDTSNGPAVFARLSRVSTGDVVLVHRADGTTVEFRVQRVEQHAKTDFPTTSVYGSSAVPTLRLITCGGTVDPRSGHYTDNVVVFATLAD